MPARGQGTHGRPEGGHEEDAHHQHHGAHGDLLADAHQLHSHEHHARADHVEQQDPGQVGQAEPAAEHRRGAGEIGADVKQHRQAQQGKGQAGEDRFQLPGEQLRVEAGDELRAVVVVAQLRDDQMQDEVEQVAEAQDQQDLPQAVVGGQIGDRQNAGAYAVTDDDAGGLPEGQPGFAVDRFHLEPSRVCLLLSLCGKDTV